VVGRLAAGLALVVVTALSGLPGHAAEDQVWRDPARGGREIPVRLYLPEGKARHPVVIFTPGLGGDRESAAYLGQHWASRGYLALFLQHPGTDSALSPEQLRRAGLDNQALLARYRDVPFALSMLMQKAQEAGILSGRVDPDRVAIAGHSLGAVGAAVAVGRKTSAGSGLADARVKAAILMSPTPGPGGNAAANFSAVSVPILHLTGTEDRDESVPQDVSERFKPFAVLKGRPQALVVFLGGDHLVFSATPSELLARPGYRAVQTSVQDITTRFFDAVLMQDVVAGRFLFEGGLANDLKGKATVQVAP
jgi:predicted dienelactone hydrolase